jgi:hypothetical protein
MEKLICIALQATVVTSVLMSCSSGKNQEKFDSDLKAIELAKGEITLCSSGTEEFGSVSFVQSCSDAVQEDFNLAIALLHSFEYTEAEKVFARVIDKDSKCVMAYWGAAMCNFHPLWAPPSPADLEKGSKIVALARSIIEDKSTREADYLEAIAAIYDNWTATDHRTRVLKFEDACRKVFEKYPDDEEAGIFYALALNAAADPKDKSFERQKKAGTILNKIFEAKPNHPGIAHYIIHNYDYPELAQLGLPAARKYASLAPASAHAQHMPSHIFTRLGLWDEAIQSNMNSVSSAQCYAEKSGMKGHWDEELHGLDYLMYAYLQKGSDDKALEQLNYVASIKEVFPVNFKVAYCLAAVPARYALERKDWEAASSLEVKPETIPWDKFPWEKANIHFARTLGAVHQKNLKAAKTDMKELERLHAKLAEAKDDYKANLVSIQIKTSQAWIKFAEGDQKGAIVLMTEAADMEDATAKHPVTPGEIIPARELLGDMLLEMNKNQEALAAYELDLEKHPKRFNGLYGAIVAAERLNQGEKAKRYKEDLVALTNGSILQRSYGVMKNL